LFLSSYLHASNLFIGLIEGIAESTASLLKLYSGYFSDKLKNRKGLIFTGYTLSSIARPLIAFASVPFHVLLIRFSDRIGKGIRTSPRDALISVSTEPDKFGRAFGFQRGMDHLGAAAGPLIVFLILSFSSLKLTSIFLLAGIPGLLTIPLIIFFLKEKPFSSAKKQKLFLLNGNFSSNFKCFLLSIAIFTLGNSSDAFLLLKAQQSGVNIAHIPLLWGAFHIVKSLSSMPLGHLSDKIGRKKVILAGWIVYFIVYVLIGYADNSYQIWILFLVYGLYYGFTEGVEKAFVSELVESERIGSAFGIYHFVVGIMALPASLLFGFLWDAVDAKTAFLTGAFFSFIASFVLIFFVKEKKN